MHFYESSVITTKDGMHCQVYGNEHPLTGIFVKPKYIPTDKIVSNALDSRFISGRKMNRLNMWINQNELKRYIESFKEHYSDYIFKSDIHSGKRLFFQVPIDKIERIYSPKKGLLELMSIRERELDSHLRLIQQLVNFFLESSLKLKDLGITYSSLVGHYHSNVSDINIVVHGKDNFWRLMKYLESAEHPLLKWKTEEQWMNFYKKRNRYNIFSREEFLKIMSRKKSEGYFGDSLFVLFGVEEENETWFKWGKETYEDIGLVTLKGIVKDNYNSIVRPGFYEIEESRIISGYEDVPVKRVVFYSRDYAMLAYPGEQIHARGILEKVSPKNKEPHYRVVVGYFDSYLDERREQEYIKRILPESINKFSKHMCALCKEASLNAGDITDYKAKILYKTGNSETDWFATLSPRTGGDSDKDFSIQISPNAHLINFSQINKHPKLAENYGLIFGRVNYAVSEIVKGQGNGHIIPIGTYGKCKHPDEHIHIKIFPYRGDIGQPFTTDSSYEKKEVFIGDGEEFVKMKPVKKQEMPQERFDYLSNKLMGLMK